MYAFLKRRRHGSSMLIVTGLMATAAMALACGSTGPSPPREAVFHQDVAWSPDGGTLAFSQVRTDGEFRPENWSVYTIDLLREQVILISPAARTVTWSPDGSRIAFAALRDGDWEIVTADRTGGSERRLTANPGTDSAPAWSPDGESIAFHSDRTGTFRIFTMDRDGKNPRQITNGEGDDHNPSWSPDGRSIVFYRARGDGADQIWTVSPDGKETRITDDDHNNIFPSFRPDGRIAFASKLKDGKSFLVHVRSDGTDRVEIPEIETFFARHAPDGRRVAFIEGKWPRSAIYVASPSGRKTRKVVN